MRATASLARWFAAALLWWGGGWAQAAASCEAPVILANAERVIAAPRSAPVVEAVPVPDRLGLAQRAADLRIQYTLDTRACAGEPAAALWLFRVGGLFTIRDDAGRPLTLLSAGGRFELEDVLGWLLPLRDGVYNGRIPALFALPPGTRSVRIELTAPTYLPAGLIGAELGRATELLPRHATQLENVVAFADAASGVVLVLGALALLLWLERRSDRTLLWLALACGLWGLRGVAYFGPRVPVPPLLFEQFNPFNILLAQAAVTAGVMPLLGIDSPRLRRLLWGVTGLTVAVLVLSLWAGHGIIQVRTLCFAVATVMLVSLIVAAWRHRHRLPRWRAATVITALGTLLVCAFHDVLVMAARLPASEPSYVFWGFVLMLIAFTAMSGQYVVATLNRAEQANEELEHRVRGKTAELEQSYARLRESERETARTQERERLLRDMHDGLGAQLVTALRGLERGALAPQQVRQSLQDSLDELRLLMDSADMGHYLPGALAAWRNRWDHRLAAAGVALAWRIDESLDEAQLPGESALQVMRILQEAATNIVKHAQARQMELEARVEPGTPPRLMIAIRDDGVGLPPGTAHPGARGLKNMQHRAAQIGAQLAILPREGRPGTEVLLLLPLA